MQSEEFKGGYYKVQVDIGGRKVPFIVFADSEYQVAHKVRMETGRLPAVRDIDGPFGQPLN